MKTTILVVSILFAPAVLLADEVHIEVKESGTSSVFSVKAGETTIGHFEWDGVPGKTGEMSGGAYEISVQMVNKEVVLTEITRSTHEGIRSETTAKTFVPLRLLPWTGKLSGKSVRLFLPKSPNGAPKSPSKSD